MEDTEIIAALQTAARPVPTKELADLSGTDDSVDIALSCKRLRDAGTVILVPGYGEASPSGWWLASRPVPNKKPPTPVPDVIPPGTPLRIKASDLDAQQRARKAAKSDAVAAAAAAAIAAIVTPAAPKAPAAPETTMRAAMQKPAAPAPQTPASTKEKTMPNARSTKRSRPILAILAAAKSSLTAADIAALDPKNLDNKGVGICLCNTLLKKGFVKQKDGEGRTKLWDITAAGRKALGEMGEGSAEKPAKAARKAKKVATPKKERKGRAKKPRAAKRSPLERGALKMEATRGVSPLADTATLLRRTASLLGAADPLPRCVATADGGCLVIDADRVVAELTRPQAAAVARTMSPEARP